MQSTLGEFPMKNIRVAIDATCLGRRKTGNETYIRGVLDGFQMIQPANLELEVITTPHYAGPRPDSFVWREIPLGHFISRNFWKIPQVLSQSKPQLYHASFWTKFWDRVPKIVSVHDISFVCIPSGYKRHELLVYRSLIKLAAQKAARILTLSEFSKREICERWKIAPDKVTVTYLGLDDCFRPSAERVKTAPSILYVGNLHPRKNLIRLLQAFILLKREKKTDARLKIVGQKAWLYDDIFETVRKNKIESDVEFTGYISQDELVRHYQAATVMVYPSVYEGFGLPVLEAMGCGTPVVSSNTTSIPEVAGDACELVNPESVEEIAAGIWRVISSPERQAELRHRSLEQAKKFDWKTTASQILQAYSQTIGQ
jgi:glycosyltransferase involved in cell wall biosynthesis